ncbi:MAG: 7-cyano-7-deazaguanine synthase [Elusimicrobia bacterium]|nr:7-cyano-7-deazaguanine synthase [Elusimicrobiota bacterium]
MIRREKVIVLTSGGFDSAALLAWAVQRYRLVQPLYCRFGLRWEKAELYWLKKFLAAYQPSGLLPLSVLENSFKSQYRTHWSLTGEGVPGICSPDPSVYLPGRNIALLSQAGIYAAKNDYKDIVLGTLASNPFPDATPQFFRSMGQALTHGLEKKIRIGAPFRKTSKQKVFKLFPNLPFHLVFSCLNPKRLRPCGDCNKCAELTRLTRSLPLGARTSQAQRAWHLRRQSR